MTGGLWDCVGIRVLHLCHGYKIDFLSVTLAAVTLPAEAINVTLAVVTFM